MITTGLPSSTWIALQKNDTTNPHVAQNKTATSICLLLSGVLNIILSALNANLGNKVFPGKVLIATLRFVTRRGLLNCELILQQTMGLYVVVLLLLGIYVQLSVCSEQKVSKWAPRFGLKLFNTSPTLHFSPHMEQKTNKVNGNAASKHNRNGKARSNSALPDPINSIAQVLKRNAADVKKDLVLCYRTITGARNSYERIEKTIDVLLAHKRSLAVGIICACGLYSKVAIHPEK